MQRFSLFAFLFLSSVVAQLPNQPFYAQKGQASDLVSKIRFNEYEGPGKDVHPEIDTNAIIAPIMRPFIEIYDAVQENYKAKKKAEQIQKAKEDSPFTNSKSIFDLIERLQRPPTTTTPEPPLLERLLKPYIEPWQEMAGIDFKSLTTTTPAATTEKQPQQNPLEKSLAMFFPSLRKKSLGMMTTTEMPTIFDPNYFSRVERLLFNRDKRSEHQIVKRQAKPSIQPGLALPSSPASLFPNWEKPILDISNPFTPNPLMAMFTTKEPIQIKIPEPAAEKHNPLTDPIRPPLFQPQFKLQDPFYNPLYPNRRSKIFDLLAGGEAARILG